MRIRWLIPLGLAAAGAARPAFATTAPHDSSNTSDPGGTQCQSCHSLHNALGTALQNKATNFDVCDSCHSSKTGFGFPWARADQAVPGAGGNHHNWENAAVNTTYETQTPQTTAMASRLKNGNLQCSTCHDQHVADASYAPSSYHFGPGTVGAARGVPTGNPSPPAGTATLTLTKGAGQLLPKGYRVRIGPALNQFQVAHDAALATPTWGTAYTFTAGTPVTLSQAADDPNLQVTISSTTTDKVGDFWDFYVGYPFLRATNASGEMCEDCHRARVNNDTTSGADGTKVFSHPAGSPGGTPVSLSRSYDRTVGSNGPILDANGAGQGTGSADANATNDIVLGAGNKVMCLTCHSPHNADSNSLTVDVR